MIDNNLWKFDKNCVLNFISGNDLKVFSADKLVFEVCK